MPSKGFFSQGNIALDRDNPHHDMSKPILIIDPRNPRAVSIRIDRIVAENVAGEERKKELIRDAQSKGLLSNDGMTLAAQGLLFKRLYTVDGDYVFYTNLQEIVNDLENFTGFLYTYRPFQALFEIIASRDSEIGGLRNQIYRYREKSDKKIQSQNHHLSREIARLNKENAALKIKNESLIRSVDYWIDRYAYDGNAPKDRVSKSAPRRSKCESQETKQSERDYSLSKNEDNDEDEENDEDGDETLTCNQPSKANKRHMGPSSESDNGYEPATKRQRQRTKPCSKIVEELKLTPPSSSLQNTKNSLRKKMPGWTDDEKSALAVAVVDIHQRSPLRDLRLFRRVAERLESQGIIRSATACKNQWNREGRGASGYDERGRGDKTRLRTSVQ